MDFHVQKSRIYTFLDRDIDLLATFYEESGRIEFNCLTRDYYWHNDLQDLGRFINRICQFVKEKEKEIKKENRHVKKEIKREDETRSQRESERQQASQDAALARQRRYAEKHSLPEEYGEIFGTETIGPGSVEDASEG